jgi:ferritin-like metal-binding protein YciE
MLGLDLAVKSLQMTLAEEKVADATLIKLARSTMNEQAAPSLPKTRSVGGGGE